MRTVVFVEGERDLEFLALVMSNFKQFEPHVPRDADTARSCRPGHADDGAHPLVRAETCKNRPMAERLAV